MINRFSVISFILISSFLLSTIPAKTQTIDEIKKGLLPEYNQHDNWLRKKEFKKRGLGGEQVTVKKPEVILNLPFDLNSHELNRDVIIILKKLGQALQDETLKKFIFRIEGHTCDRGTSLYNFDLSHRRAYTVLNYLFRNVGLEKEQFELAWFGESQPIVPNLDEVSRKKNRRVVIINTLKTFDPNVSSQKHALFQIKCLRDGMEQIVQNGDKLYENDPYAIEFRIRTKPYVYIYQVDDWGKVSKLFPNEKFTKYSNPLKVNHLYRIPSNRYWFYLDENKGKEKIIMLAYNRPIKNPKEICISVAEGKIVSQRTRGIKIKSNEKLLAVPSSGQTKSFLGYNENLLIIMRYFNHY